MPRKLFFALVATALGASIADARIVWPEYSPVEKVARTEIVVVGTVRASEKDTVIADAWRANKIAHKVAIVKVEKVLLGTDVPKRVGVAFLQHDDPKVFVRPPGRGGYEPVNLAVGHAGVFFLTRHESGEFYTI